MRFAILSAGKSIEKTWSERMYPFYDVVIAVNNAAMLYRHHITCALDGFMWRRVMSNGKYPCMEVAFRGDLCRNATPCMHPGGSLVSEWEMVGICSKMGIKKPKISFSICAAIYLCAYIAKKRSVLQSSVDIFGHDARGVGIGTSREYSETRWIKERALFAQAIDYLDGAGINYSLVH